MNGALPAPAERQYLLVAGPPTPNGRLHLGHIAGPYLKIDVLARHLRRFGHRAVTISGIDAFDSFVLLHARENGLTPDETCRRFSEQIQRDFRAVDIDFDAFIDPLGGEWSELYASLHRETIKDLVAGGAVELRRERFLYSPSGQRYIVGCWLLGRCPSCGTEAGSYVCEQCGAGFRPEQLRAPRPRFDEGDLEWRELTCPYLRLPNGEQLYARLAAMGVRPEFQRLARRHVEEQGTVFRLTQPGRWGIPWPLAGDDGPQVLFSNHLAHARTCGEIFRHLVGTGPNAFDPASDVTTVRSMGIDNALAALVGGVGGALAHGAVKPFDHLLFNHFYTLDHAKFSTSRGHAIWTGELVQRVPAGGDALRAYLVRVNPERGVANFDVRDFVAFTNDQLAGRFQGAVVGAWPELALDVGAPPGGMVARLRRLLEQQERALAPEAFHLSESVRAVDVWLADRGCMGDGQQVGYWWLKGLALLAYPSMPAVSAAIWEGLGHSDQPTTVAFDRPAHPRLSRAPVLFRPIAASDLAPCLPVAHGQQPGRSVAAEKHTERRPR